MKQIIPFSEVKNFIVTKLLLVSNISTAQHKFMSNLFITIFTMPFRINFLMMSRFSSYSEKTYRNHFSSGIDLAHIEHIKL